MYYRTILPLILVIFCIFNTGFAATASATTPLLQRPDVQKFIRQTAKKYHLDETNIKKVMSYARIEPNVIEAMQRPYEAKPWYVYRKHFLTPDRIQHGTQFWQQHANDLKKAEQEYGVPASVIVAIIGVETNYGKQQGSFPVLNSLTTLAFDYPKRSAFFKKELAEFLVLAHENKLDPTAIKGSYAGAIGQPQFMPSSYRHYAIDFAKNGQVDLLDNTTDVIGSIANYLQKNGWQAKQPIAESVTVDNAKNRKLANHKRKTPYTVGELQKHGIALKKTLSATLPTNLVNLPVAKNKTNYWLGFHNFYVITRYNTSILYAMAVYRLSDAIDKAHTQLALAKDGIGKKKKSS